VSRVTASENSFNSLQRTYNDQSRRLADAHANIASLTSAAAAKKASATNEVSRLLDENRILEKRAEEARSTIAEREAELERLTDAQAEKEKVWEDKWRKEERLRREAEKRSEDFKIVVERLALAQGAGTDLSPAAALAADQRQNGKSYVQFMTDYSLQEHKLRTAENEVVRLTELLDEISADILEKVRNARSCRKLELMDQKPLLDEQAAEHAAAIERSNALAAELATALTARDLREHEVKSLKAEAELRAEEMKELRTTTDDLSRQVQGLLRQIALLNDPSLANVSIDGNAEVSSDGDIITDHLVEFQSIRSLQEQNAKLLRLTRGLMAKLDAQEIDRAAINDNDREFGASLDQATETITKLHQSLVEAQKKISEVTRERDTFSKLLARGEGLRKPAQMSNNGPLDDSLGSQEQLVASLQEEMQAFRHKADVEIAEVRAQLTAKVEEAGQAEVEKAKAEAQVILLKGP
jgi:nucleoprotein TPR